MANRMTTDLGKLGKRLHKGESSAFVDLYDLLGNRLFRYVYSQVGSREDAADVIQETFVQLVKSHKKLGKANNLNGYVFAVARNEMIRWMTRKKRNKTVAGNVESEPLVWSEIEAESEEWVQATLSRLDAVDQEIIQLKVFSQLTFNEVATITKLQPSNVATRYRRAIAKLEDYLRTSNAEVEKKS
jgi:RNA polymerase sigma-70 factor (ECF subfamily)